ncbi:CDP-glycerol--glycerophosphate glycerophosphotransferase [Methanobrevibacter sp. 87.7]|uniref:CDP-glycerol glycerophosphotransferase family protein n=1 Tax=Methanobrevibacter sp. 87.7 TaxID=387957 RepID=UPI000B5137AB|nr:CDP-glycerol glycerophosphotransferase family protein [Methanobrevibacter sp. 87.7]OWT33402.1 CDP-glycerol--glycerophosphate glycerophosphotransferase [Methanobrevibacter sp. 87.7]
MALKHRIYGAIFNLLNIFPINDNSVTFVMDKNNSFIGNFNYIYKELNSRNIDFEYNCVVKNRFSISDIYHLARSKYIFLNDNFLALAYMNISNKTKVIQLWHGPGAFKKFGYSSIEFNDKDLINLIRNSSKRISYLTVTSNNIKKYYSEAFQIDEDKIIASGIPRLDFYSEENTSEDNISKIRKDFMKNHPEIKNKKIILYAPTFRENSKYNNVFKYFNVNKFINELSDEYVLLIRLHPKMYEFDTEDNINKDIFNFDNVIDCTYYENEQNLLLISDILITDYSSIMIEYSILNRPIIFFAYDLDNYLSNERGFYFDYNEVPGTIVKNTDELIYVIKNSIFKMDKLEKFLKFQFDYIDDKSSKRIIDYVLDS